MSTDGSSDAIVAAFWLLVVAVVLTAAIGVGAWLHKRAEARENAACEQIGGVRIEAGGEDVCLRRAAVLYVGRDGGR
jgi:hypothetical protein